MITSIDLGVFSILFHKVFLEILLLVSTFSHVLPREFSSASSRSTDSLRFHGFLCEHLFYRSFISIVRAAVDSFYADDVFLFHDSFVLWLLL